MLFCAIARWIISTWSFKEDSKAPICNALLKSSKAGGKGGCPLRKIAVTDAVGHILCHDITRIVPGEVQEAAFKKGHVVRPEDIPVLLSLGKEHLFVWEQVEGMLHEDDAALRIAQAVSRDGLEISSPSEGKVELHASHPGVIKIDVEVLREVNNVEQVTVVTRRTDEAVLRAGEQVAATRVIPLTIDAGRVEAVEEICRRTEGIIEVRPFVRQKVGVVITGNEVYHGRIEDGFAPVLREKFAALGCCVMDVAYAPDDPRLISRAIRRFADEGAELVVATGGMSVDPDDRTPGAIKSTGADIVSYGVPMLPGNMFLVAYLDDLPVMGLPGCVMFKETTAFDVLVPRVLTGERLTRADIVALGHGGLLNPC